ncbi:MAG TPA: ATP-binding protein [Noviherbaspirillum sp.]
MPSISPELETLLARCEQEPIHIPGAIQPFGVLLTVLEPRLVITNASENSGACWQLPATGLIGHSLSDLLDRGDLEQLRRYLAQPELEEQPLLALRVLTGTPSDRRWDVRAHRHDGVLYLEFEPADIAGITEAGEAGFHVAVRETVRALQRAGTVQELCERAVQQVRQISGFDRVMVYRFDADWHGVVIAESCTQGADCYLGHHFPAADIPAQARAVFLQNWLRMIPDVDYAPVPLHPGVHPGSGAPLDLGKSVLRSVSPVHLQYLRHMGVKASLTISLVDEGRLWGLIACHHLSPRLLGSDARMGVELIGRLVSAQLRMKEEQEHQLYRQATNKAVDELLGLLETGPGSDLAERLSTRAPHLLDLVSAARTAVAIRYDGKWTIAGATPAVPQLQALTSWLAPRFARHHLFQTEHLGQHYPDGDAIRATASGLLAVSLGRDDDCILWLRPEVATTVTWAGPPDKTVQAGVLQPRASFASWTEQVRGTSAPWTRVEVAAVEKLRNGLLALALAEEHRKEQVARRQAERISREKDEMVMMVSHDLRTPLNVLTMCLGFLRQFHPSSEQPVQRMLVRGERAADLMARLITNILDVAKIEAGTLDLALREEDAAQLLAEAGDLTLPLAEAKGVRLSLSLPDGPGPRVCCEKARLHQVLNNFLSNALKFTPAGGSIKLDLREEGDEVVFSVADTGEGMSRDVLEQVFERFWQAEETKRQGTGLGLWIARAVVHMHGGRIWASSEPGKGSCFSFALRKVVPAA